MQRDDKDLGYICNIILRKSYYNKRQLKVLDTILEKEKGLVLGKLINIQLIKTNLQLLMQVYIGENKNNKIQNNNRLLKYNYGLRKTILYKQKFQKRD